MERGGGDHPASASPERARSGFLAQQLRGAGCVGLAALAPRATRSGARRAACFAAVVAVGRVLGGDVHRLHGGAHPDHGGANPDRRKSQSPHRRLAGLAGAAPRLARADLAGHRACPDGHGMDRLAKPASPQRIDTVARYARRAGRAVQRGGQLGQSETGRGRCADAGYRDVGCAVLGACRGVSGLAGERGPARSTLAGVLRRVSARCAGFARCLGGSASGPGRGRFARPAGDCVRHSLGVDRRR